MTRAFAAVLAALALAGCAGLQQPSAELTLAKAEFTWDNAYNTAARLYLQWAPTAAPDQKAKVKDLLVNKAWPAVKAADTAAGLGQAQAASDQAAIVTSVAAQVTAIVNATH
jgi:hypothetical protein